jgi:hypothetical protein
VYQYTPEAKVVATLQGNIFVGVDEAGAFKFVRYLVNEKDYEYMSNLESSVLRPLLFGLTLTNVKGSKTHDPRIVKQASRKQRRHANDHPRLLYRVITLPGTPARSPGLPRTGKHLDRLALHLVRGHFATYTEAAPLFGRQTGTFWRPAHTRGNAEHGVIEKDYEVIPAK